MKKSNPNLFQNKEDLARATKDKLKDLIENLLSYNPNTRKKPLQALAEPFFDELREQDAVLPNGDPLPDLFNFTDEEIGSTNIELIKQLIP